MCVLDLGLIRTAQNSKLHANISLDYNSYVSVRGISVLKLSKWFNKSLAF